MTADERFVGKGREGNQLNKTITYLYNAYTLSCNIICTSRVLAPTTCVLNNSINICGRVNNGVRGTESCGLCFPHKGKTESARSIPRQNPCGPFRFLKHFFILVYYLHITRFSRIFFPSLRPRRGITKAVLLNRVRRRTDIGILLIPNRVTIATIRP